MAIILGEVIRRRIREDNRSAQEICDAVGMSRGNLDKIYKKEAINTDLLAKLCIELKFDFFDYVNPFKLAGESLDPNSRMAQEDFSEYRTPITRIQKCLGELHDTRKELDMLEKEVVMLRSTVDDKNRIIKLLESRIQDFHERVDDLKTQLKEAKHTPPGAT